MDPGPKATQLTCLFQKVCSRHEMKIFGCGERDDLLTEEPALHRGANISNLEAPRRPKYCFVLFWPHHDGLALERPWFRFQTRVGVG
jgi:hypothetical protein